tara:strand:- start:7707 stop:8129 length:423 start_codon:yes stop_codon:yes gene_type:complete
MSWHEILVLLFGTGMAVWAAIANVGKSRLDEKLKIAAQTGKAALTAKGVLSQELETLTDRYRRTEDHLKREEARSKRRLEALTAPQVTLKDAAKATEIPLRKLQELAKAQRTPFRKVGSLYTTDLLSYTEWKKEMGGDDS